MWAMKTRGGCGCGAFWALSKRGYWGATATNSAAIGLVVGAVISRGSWLHSRGRSALVAVAVLVVWLVIGIVVIWPLLVGNFARLRIRRRGIA